MKKSEHTPLVLTDEEKLAMVKKVLKYDFSKDPVFSKKLEEAKRSLKKYGRPK